MQENEFEKRLQEEMDEFRLRPSEVVWNKIEDELKKKKRRRVVFFMFLLAGLSLIGYSGYVLFTPGKENRTAKDVAITNTTEPNSPRTEPTDNDSQKSIPNDQKTIAKQKQAKDQQQILVPAEIKTGTKVGEPNTGKKSRSNKPPAELQTTELAKKKEQPPSENSITRDEKIIAHSNDKDNKTLIEPATIAPAELAEKNIKAEEELTAEKKQVDAAKSDSAIAAIEIKEQSPAVDQLNAKKKSSSAVKWGLDLSVGVSQISNKAFSFSGVSQSADALYISQSNGTGGNTGGNLNSYRAPSDVLRGIAFKTGIVGEMNLSKRSSVSAGLGYAYYSNNIKTGSPKDSSFVLRTMTAQSVALDSYYQGSQVMEYTNHYHFIQLPIYYQLQLNKGVKVPIIWSIGVAPAYLFSTNALIYDTARGGIYYKNNDAFNKFHFNLNTGLSFRFGKANKLQWSVGPELSMDMTGLMKDADQKRYFMYGGITGRVYFKKKNNK